MNPIQPYNGLVAAPARAGLSEKKIDVFLSIAMAALLIGICAHIFFSPGHTYNLDGASHSVKSLMVYQSIKDGDFPIWSNLWHTGFAFLQFYPPFYFLLAGSLNFLFHDIIITIKTLTFVAQILSGFFVYLLVKEISDSRRAGMVAGLAYSLSPWHVFHMVVFSRFTASVIYFLFPLLFYCYERFRKGKDSLPGASIAAGFFLFLIVSFQYGYAVFCTYFLILYLFLDSFQSPLSRPKVNNTKFLLVSGLIAAGLSLFLFLPFIMESPNMYGKLMGEKFWNLKKFLVDSADFEALYTRKGTPVFHKGYLGIGFSVMSLLGVIQAFRRKRYVLILLYGLAIFFVLGHETSVYRYIPLIYAQYATSRLIIYQIFFMAVLAGLGWDMIEEFLLLRQAGPYVTVSVFVLVVALLIWDVSIMFNIKWSSNHYGLKPVYKALKQDMIKRKDSQGRIFHVFVKSGMDWTVGGILPSIQVIETFTPNLWGFSFPAGVTRSGVFIQAGMRWVREDIIKNRAIGNSLNFLHLTDTAYLIFVGPNRKIQTINLSPHTPVVASGNLFVMNNHGKNPQELCRNIIPKMGLNREGATAQILFSREPISDYRPLPTPQIRLLEYRQTVNRTHLRIQSKTDTYLRIAHSYYRYLQLTLDGTPIPFFPTTLEFILIRFPAGTHTVEISPVLSPLRKVTLLFSGLFFLAALFYYFRLRDKRYNRKKALHRIIGVKI